MLELLVVLVIAGFVFTMLVQMIHLGWRSTQAETRTQASANEFEATVRLLRELISGMNPGDASELQGTFAGSRHAASFITTLPQGAGAAITHEADVGLGVDTDHRLELRWRPHYRRWISRPPEPARIVLVDGVERLDLGFLQPAVGATPAQWLTAWSGRTLPKLIRLQVVFPGSDVRRWPDIIIAPMREAPRP